jgi:hypothetical protein
LSVTESAKAPQTRATMSHFREDVSPIRTLEKRRRKLGPRRQSYKQKSLFGRTYRDSDPPAPVSSAPFNSASSCQGLVLPLVQTPKTSREANPNSDPRVLSQVHRAGSEPAK